MFLNAKLGNSSEKPTLFLWDLAITQKSYGEFSFPTIPIYVDLYAIVSHFFMRKENFLTVFPTFVTKFV